MGIWGGLGAIGRAPGAPPGRAATGCPGRAGGAVRPAATPGVGDVAVGAGLGAGLWIIRGGAVVGNGGVGDVGRCSSIRRRSVGGTTRPGVAAFGGGASTGGAATSGWAALATCAAGTGVSTGGASTGASATGAGACAAIGSGSGT
jgi:hypothetical protein